MKIILSILILFTFIFSGVSVVYAQEQNFEGVLDNVPLGTEKGPENVDSVINIFLSLTRWIFVIATGIGVIMMIVAGIKYMTAGGTEGAKSGSKTLMYAAIGTAVALASSFIIQIIKNILLAG